MRVHELVKRLQQLPQDALVVTMATEDGYNSTLGACLLSLAVRRPTPYPRLKGYGEFVNADSLLKKSRARRLPAVMIGLLTGDQRPFDEQHNLGRFKRKDLKPCKSK